MIPMSVMLTNQRPTKMLHMQASEKRIGLEYSSTISPKLDDIVLNSAKLRLYVSESISGAKVTAALYDQNQKFSGLTYNDWIPVMDRKILDAEGSFTFTRGSSSYDEWIEIILPI